VLTPIPNKVISIFGKSMAASGAEDSDRILQLLIGLYEKEKQLDEKTDEEDVEKFSLQPGVGHFVSVLLAYQKRRMNSPSAVQRIEELLVQMDRIHQAGNDLVRPNYQVRRHVFFQFHFLGLYRICSHIEPSFNLLVLCYLH